MKSPVSRRVRGLATALWHLLPPERRLEARLRLRRLRRPAVLGTVRRTQPLSDSWGSDRGTPVDRFYIEQFLDEHRADIRGRVLEVKDDAYTTRFGVGVSAAEVLDIDETNPRATIIADLAHADTVESESFDCFVLTQTLQLIPDLPAALAHARRLLRPGGVLLATMPSISRLVGPAESDHDYWRFTPAGCRRLFAEIFGGEAVEVRWYGNVLTSIAFLTGMAVEELRRSELVERDDLYPLVVAVRATRLP
jgi:SAM-dependent methyltransferase